LLVVTTICGAVFAAGSVEAIGPRAPGGTPRPGARIERAVVLESTALVLLGIGLLGSASFLRRMTAKRAETIDTSGRPVAGRHSIPQPRVGALASAPSERIA
jgi:hypothetical protein